MALVTSTSGSRGLNTATLKDFWYNGTIGLSVTCLSLTYSLQAALQELEELKQIVPKESLVYFLIGKVTRKCISC